MIRSSTPSVPSLCVASPCGAGCVCSPVTVKGRNPLSGLLLERGRDRSIMRRTAIAAAWIAGATVPLLVSVVFLFGCCVLPFHAYIHKAMPLCSLAVGFLSGEHAGHHHGGAQQPLPAREKQEPVKRVATDLPRSFHLSAASPARPTPATIDASAYRSFISFGALRCDQDVGLYTL